MKGAPRPLSRAAPLASRHNAAPSRISTNLQMQRASFASSSSSSPRKSSSSAKRGAAPPSPSPQSAPVPPSVPTRRPEDVLMEQFVEEKEEEEEFPLISTREEFGKKYLFEMITMPIRTPDANVREMKRTMTVEDADKFFLDKPLSPENISLYFKLCTGLPTFADRVRSLFTHLSVLGRGVHVSTYCAAAFACIKANNPSLFREIEHKMLRDGIPMNLTFLHAKVGMLARMRRFADAEAILQKEMNPIVNPDPEVKKSAKLAYTSLIKGYVMARHFEKAWETFNYMRTYIAQPDTMTFTVMIQLCTNLGQAERALNFYQEMRKLNLPITEKTYDALIMACARRHETLSDAFLIAETMRAVGFVPTMTTYKALTLAAANAGDVPRVRAIIQEMEGEGLKLDPAMRAMHIKALTVSMRGKSTVAINDILYEAQKIFDTEKNPSMPLINTMLVAFATALRPAKTLQFFNDIKLKYHHEPTYFSYSAVVQMWVRLHRFEVAEKWLEDMTKAGYPPEKHIYLLCIDHAARRGRVNMALMYLRALVTKLGIKPRKDEVESLWHKGKEDIAVRRELDLLVQQRYYLNPRRRAVDPDKPFERPFVTATTRVKAGVITPAQIASIERANSVAMEGVKSPNVRNSQHRYLKKLAAQTPTSPALEAPPPPAPAAIAAKP